MIQFAIVILLFAGTQQDQVTIEAPKQERNQNISDITGPFVITYQDIRVEGDTATYDHSTKEVTAEGRLHFTRGEENLEADHITFNLETKSGVLTNASGELGPGFLVTAEEAQRTEDGIYYLKNATITTCDGPRPGWTMAFARAKVNTNRRVSARNSIFKLESVPLFYLPYVTLPTGNRDRSTGFLIPSFTATSTTKGTSVRESFFWAINRSADALFTGEYFSKRGPAGRVLFQAVPSATSRITVDSLFAKDRKGQGGQSVRILAFGDLTKDLRGVADMNLVSSIVFRQVYEDGFNTISSPIEHELAFLTRDRPDASINAIYDRRVIFFADQPSVALRKFPTLEISVPDRPLGRFPAYFSVDTGFSGVARSDAAIKVPAFAERYDLHPSLEIPLIRSAAFDWSQRLGVRETIYTHSLDQKVVRDALNRLSFDYTSEFTGPQAERDFGRWRHVVEPSVTYRYIGGADRFRETIVVDDVDLVTNTNEVEYALTNRLFTTREIFSWRLAQKYFFDPTFGGAIVPGQRNVFAPLLDISGFAFADGRRRVSPIVSTMRLSTSAATSTDFQVDYDTRDHLFRSAGVIGGVNRGQWLGQVSYFFTQRSAIEIPSNQLRTTLSYGNNLKPGVSGAFSLSYDVQRSLFQGAVAQVGYNTDCFGLIFEYKQFNIGARNERSFGFAFSLKNIGSYGTIRRQERLF